ncbi:MAG: 30S ribosomal protein S12 methylthiotransferase RimO [Planctomycetaceae bacterium]|nr:30S ribosomal protein S12 methylthiotransferase RimO [Planctomycetaceae bacterium]
METQSVVTVGFVALGCPKNVVDSEVMLARLGQSGLVLSPDPDHADVVVINTCGFIEPAKEEALEAIRRAIRYKKKGHIRKIVVAGCLSERMGQALSNEIKGIDAIVGLARRDQIAEIVQQVLREPKSKQPDLFLEHEPGGAKDDRGRLLITPAHWAYLRISEGCNRRCSFCTIPAIRGQFQSKPMQMVLDEAKELAANGAVELSLIAQDSNFYGRDLGLKDGLCQLIRELEKIDSLEWIRLMYLYPAGIDDRLLESIAACRKVVHYIDMPIQHINNRILKSMCRADTREHTIELISKIRNCLAGAVLRTTVMVGYPAETDAEFAELLEFIEWARFDALGCFRFSPEPGTAAAGLPGQLPEGIKHQRADAVMSAQQKIAFANMDGRKGKEYRILIDEAGPHGSVGRFYGQAPHIDSVCKLPAATAAPGGFIQANVIGRDGYDLIAEPL